MAAFLPLEWLIGATTLLVLSTTLLFTGLRPRRTGTTRFCRACGYDLSGTVEPRCSECGRDLNCGRAVVVGRRVRKPIRSAIGALVLLACLIVLGAAGYGWATRVDWYEFKPHSWMIDDLAGRNPRLSARAISALDSRRIAGKLTTAELRRICDVALAAQLKEDFRARHMNLMRFLRDLYADGALNAEQERRMLAQALRVTRVLARERVLAGSEISIEANYVARVPDGSLMSLVRIKSLKLPGGGAVDVKSEVVGASGWTDSGRVKARALITTPGRYDALAEIELSATTQMYAPVPFGRQVYHDTLLLPITIEVLPAEHGSAVRLIDDAGMAALIPGMLTARFASRAALPGVSGSAFDAHIRFESGFPCDAAFDVWLEWPGADAPRNIGAVLYERDAAQTRHLLPGGIEPTASFTFYAPEPAPQRVTLVLRPAPGIAARTLEITSVWGQEVRLENVPLGDPPGGLSDRIREATQRFRSRLPFGR